jgi:hypothetical protein
MDLDTYHKLISNEDSARKYRTKNAEKVHVVFALFVITIDAPG